MTAGLAYACIAQVAAQWRWRALADLILQSRRGRRMTIAPADAAEGQLDPGQTATSSVHGRWSSGGHSVCVAARMAARKRRPAGSLVQGVREGRLLEAAFRGWLAVTRVEGNEQQLALVSGTRGLLTHLQGFGGGG